MYIKMYIISEFIVHAGGFAIQWHLYKCIYTEKTI